MKWMSRLGVLASVVVLMAGASIKADELVIDSFDSTGRLIFNVITNASSYRVEWASSPSGPWNSFSTAAASLDLIFGSGSVTSSVPVFYRVVASLRSVMVLIPGGTNAGTDPDFGPYSLTVSSFYMDEYPVTKRRWDEVYIWAIEHGYSFANLDSDKAANHPVVNVNWYDVVKWCNARSEMESRTPVYTVNGAVYKAGQHTDVVQTSAAGYRLPTSTEWEYAARGGLTSQRFPWGETINHSNANYTARADGTYPYEEHQGYSGVTYHPTYNYGNTPYTSPVGSFAPNGYGLYDMVGNVVGWCFDLHPGPAGNRVGRGGSWGDSAVISRVGVSLILWPADARNNIGFRAVLPPGQ